MTHWMFNCRKVTQMVSESLDRKLPLHKRLGLWMHMRMCRFCSRFKKQLYLLTKIMPQLSHHLSDELQLPPLSAETRNRMERAIQKNLPFSV